jgi:two-component system LytT family sensor kinase
MTLQLLVENAIKHGLAPRPAGGRLSLAAQLDAAGTSLCVAVRNTGTFRPQPGHPGLGLRNVHERLGLLFGTAAHFAIGPDPLLPDTVLAELHLPIRDLKMPHERASY